MRIKHLKNQVAFYLAFCLSTCLATFGPDAHFRRGKGPEKVIVDSPKIHLDSPRIHLDSPKFVLNKPKVIDDGHLIEEGYGHAAVHSSPAAVAPILINGGYGGYGGAKVLNVGGPVVVAPTPIVHHDGPILVRRPVVVAKELAPTQDHLEKIHYDRLGFGNGYISGGHGLIGGGHGFISGGHGLIGGGHGLIGGGHGLIGGGQGLIGGGHGYGHGPIVSAVPIAGKGIGPGVAAYGKGAPIHSLGSGLISFQAYHTPYLVGQPRAILAEGPAHIGAGHGLIGGGHGLIGGGHGFIGGGHGLIGGGHGLIGGGHGHIGGGHGHIGGGHGHIDGGHGHISDIHGSGGYKKY